MKMKPKQQAIFDPSCILPAGRNNAPLPTVKPLLEFAYAVAAYEAVLIVQRFEVKEQPMIEVGLDFSDRGEGNDACPVDAKKHGGIEFFFEFIEA